MAERSGRVPCVSSLWPVTELHYPPPVGRRARRWLGGPAGAAALALSCLVTASPLAAETFQVGAGHPYADLEAVDDLLDPGDLVLVYGDATYLSAWITRDGTAAQPITLRGVRVDGKRPVLSGGSNTLELQGDHYVVEGFEITGGAARCLYHHAHGIVVRDTVVHGCPKQGILGADTDSGSLTLEHVEVYDCGGGDRDHCIYMATNEEDHPGAVFRMQHSYVHGVVGGNAVKSRAERNEIYFNWIETTATGSPPYHLLELIGPDPAGGVDAGQAREDSDVVGNVLVQHSAFPFVRIGGDGTGESAGRYRFVNNTFVRMGHAIDDQEGGAVFRCFDALESVEMHGNVFHNTGAGVGLNLIRTTEADWTTGVARISGQNNWVESGSINVPAAWTGTGFGADPGFVDVIAHDLRPAPGSPLIDAGASSPAPPPGYPFPNPLFPPAFQPPMRTLTPGVPSPRPLVGAIDIGAYETGGLFADGFESGSTAAWSAATP